MRGIYGRFACLFGFHVWRPATSAEKKKFFKETAEETRMFQGFAQTYVIVYTLSVDVHACERCGHIDSFLR